jgi:hypothetical protein
MIFCKPLWAFIMLVSFVPTLILVSLVAYWHTLDMTWPLNGATSCSKTYNTTCVDVNKCVQVCALILDISNNLVYELIFNENKFHLFDQCCFIGVWNFKQPYYNMLGHPIIINKINHEHECIKTSFGHLEVKCNNVCNTLCNGLQHMHLHHLN